MIEVLSYSGPASGMPDFDNAVTPQLRRAMQDPANWQVTAKVEVDSLKEPKEFRLTFLAFKAEEGG